MGARRHHRARARRRVLALEDSGADKDAVVTFAAGGEADLLDEVDGDALLLRVDVDLVLAHRLEARHLGVHRARVADRVSRLSSMWLYGKS